MSYSKPVLFEVSINVKARTEIGEWRHYASLQNLRVKNLNMVIEEYFKQMDKGEYESIED